MLNFFQKALKNALHTSSCYYDDYDSLIQVNSLNKTNKNTFRISSTALVYSHPLELLLSGEGESLPPLERDPDLTK